MTREQLDFWQEHRDELLLLLDKASEDLNRATLRVKAQWKACDNTAADLREALDALRNIRDNYDPIVHGTAEAENHETAARVVYHIEGRQ